MEASALPLGYACPAVSPSCLGRFPVPNEGTTRTCWVLDWSGFYWQTELYCSPESPMYVGAIELKRSAYIAQPAQVSVTIEVTGPCNYRSRISGTSVDILEPGLWYFYMPDVVPEGSCPGTYQVSFSVTSTTSPNPATGAFQLEAGFPPAATYGMCGTGLHGANPTGCAAEPVNTFTGSYTTSVTDVSLPGIGVPFAFTRTYNSGDTTTGPLGPGWTHSLRTYLVVSKNGASVTLFVEDGKQYVFSRQSDGSYRGPAWTTDTLIRLPDKTFRLTRKDQSVYSFSSSGLLTSLRDRNGQGLTLSYSRGTLTQVTDASGRVVRFSYRQGLLTSLALSDGRTVAYEYSGGRLARVTDLRGGVTAYGYDGSGRVTTITDQRGNVILRNAYASNGRVVQQTDAVGNVTTFAWDATLQEATVTDPRGGRWIDRYRGGVLVSQTDPLGNRTVYIHDAALNLVELTDAAGRTWRMTYDGRGNLLSRTAPSPLSFVERWTYTAANDVDTYTDPRGNVTDYDYDAKGNLVAITEPLGTVTRFGRDPATGLVRSVTDPRGKRWTYEYDARGRLVATVSPLGNRTTLGYDASDRLTSEVEPRGNAAGNQPSDYTWRYAYDAGDNLTSVTSALGHVTRYGYDPAGNLVTVTDPRGRVTRYEYDAAGRLVRIVAADGSATTYAYDGAGNLIRRTDAEGRSWAFAYDGANRLASVTSPSGRVWSYAYGPTGTLRSKTLPSGNATPQAGDGTITYSYDAADRLTRIDHSDATPDVTFTYDANSNVMSMADGTGGTETYAYDALNRLTEVRRGTDVLAYGYDAAGNVVSRTYPDGTTVSSSYDDDGRLASVTEGPRTTTYAYDEAGNLLRRSLPTANGYAEIRRYDRDGRLVEVTSRRDGEVLAGFSYTLDEVGNPIRVDSPSGVATYRYDSARDFLVEVCFQASCPGTSDPFIRYSYDRVGNRLSEDRPTGTTTYTYDEDDRLLQANGPGGSVTYAYDLNGNLTGAGDRSYAFDLENRMTSATAGGVTTSYAYDGLGRRVRATTGGTILRFLWDPNWPLPMLALERDGGGTVLRRYIYGDGAVSVRADGTEHFVHRDALGSVVGVTSASGNPEWAFAYEPFGAVRSAVRLSPSAPAIPLSFAGEYRDAETGLLHLRARAYDPSLGRFLQQDPMPPALRDPYLATYVYVANRPTVLTDPSGECFLVCAIIGAGVGALTYAATVALDDEVGWSWKGFGVSTAGGALLGFTGGGASALGLGVVRTAILGGFTSAAVDVLSAGICGAPLPGAGDLAGSFLEGAALSALGSAGAAVFPALSRSLFYQGRHLPADYLTGTEASIIDIGFTAGETAWDTSRLPLGSSCK